MADRPVTIHSACVTTPDQHVHVSAGDRIRWKADHAEIYLLKLPGGFFVDHPNAFDLIVFGQIWTDYLTVADGANGTIFNYINSLTGGCLLTVLDGPPDIIIDSALKGKRKKKGKKKKK